MSIDTYIQQHADMNINMENGSQDRFVLNNSLAAKDNGSAALPVNW